MIIQDSAINLSGKSSLSYNKKVSTNVKIERNQIDLSTNQNSSSQNGRGVVLNLSSRALEFSRLEESNTIFNKEEFNLNSNEYIESGSIQGTDLDRYEQKLTLLEQLIKALTGKDYSIDKSAIQKLKSKSQKESQGETERIIVKSPRGSGRRLRSTNISMQQLKISTSRTETISKVQSVAFSASGVIKTNDGEINLNMNFMTSREDIVSVHTESEVTVSTIRKKNCVDPLMISLDSDSFGLSDITIEFDLDSDGVMDNVFAPNKGMGFIALDKNENGKIDNGTELFGPESGDGFADLALYDEDGNGWIDENDSVFSKLKIWTFDGGSEKLLSLEEADVGAIYLSSVGTEFDIINSNQYNGVMRKTGLYIKESNKQAGRMHHIDISI